MKDRKKFKVTWEVSDGYIGGSRPHTFQIYADDLEGLTTEEELKSYLDEEVARNFQETVYPYCENETEFLTWALDVVAGAEHEE